ncbi:MAG: class I SAM-dependent methyltransferase [Leptospirales bacterium]|nr:class I SAM-dependent methyltransferase [Leptospirales bacterium]
MQFKDHFSNQAKRYADFRPDYPEALISWVASNATNKDTLWDCGTGNGQAALALAKYFGKVYATDPSKSQIESARIHPNIEYSVRTAEDSGFPSSTFDLITVAQALHWFDFEAFFAEVRRVARPGCAIVCWGYGLCDVSPAVDPSLRKFYSEVVGPYWPPERKLVDQEYKTIPFPFPKISAPQISIERDWSLEEFLGYVSSWSAVQAMQKATGSDPVSEFGTELAPVWRSSEKVRWPIYVLAGKVT